MSGCCSAATAADGARSCWLTDAGVRQHDCWDPAPLSVAVLPVLSTTSFGCSRQRRDAELQLRTLRGNVEKPESRSSLLPPPPRAPLAALLSLLALDSLRTRWWCRGTNGAGIRVTLGGPS